MRSAFVHACNVMAALRNRRRMRPSGVVKVNLGSGLHVVPGWYNVDINGAEYLRFLPESMLRRFYRTTENHRWFTEDEYVRNIKQNRHIHHNLSKSVPFADESVDCIFTSHTLEHFHRADALHILRECHRALKPGGKIRVIVPNLDWTIQLMQAPETRALGLSFFFADPKLPPFAWHRYMYNNDTMVELLREAGFDAAEASAYRQSSFPDANLLDNKPEESIYVDAQKAPTTPRRIVPVEVRGATAPHHAGVPA